MKPAHLLTGYAVFALLATPVIASAANDLTLRLAKTPDASDADKPATLAYQHNDGGKSDDVTEGAVKVDLDFGPDNDTTFSPAVSWNHNTLASTVTDNWAYSAALLRKLRVGDGDYLQLFGSVGELRDATKSSNATTVKLGMTWFGAPEWKPAESTDEATLRPTLTVFSKHVSQAKADAMTGIAPTGTMSGGLIGLSAQAKLGRWTLIGSTQFLKLCTVTPRAFIASTTHRSATSSWIRQRLRKKLRPRLGCQG